MKNPLSTTTNLFQEWQKVNIRYCHWKSNQHLAQALNGITDLDILIHQKDSKVAETILRDLGFKEVKSPSWAQYPHMHDWIGFDYTTGALCHVHLHYRLIVGQKNIKNIHLPLENWLLTNLRTQNNIYVPEYERELIILIIRILLKTSWKQLLYAKLKNKNSLPKNIRQELTWLLKKTNNQKIPLALESSNLNIPLSFFTDFIDRWQNNRLSPEFILRTQNKLRIYLRMYQRRSIILVILRKIILLIYIKFSILWGIPKKKLIQGEGHFISLVGCDGSGKTTLAKDLKRWLEWKIAVKHIYFGIPKISPFKAIILCKISFYPLAKISHVFKNPIEFLDAIWWIYVAHRRNRLYKKCITYKKQGYIVIAERFPLHEFWNMDEPMDGPRIKKHKNWLQNALHVYEQNIYKKIRLPDWVYILRVNQNTLHKRKPEANKAQQKVKAQAVNSIKQKQGYYFVDGEQTYENVFLDIKRHFWKSL